MEITAIQILSNFYDIILQGLLIPLVLIFFFWQIVAVAKMM